MPTARIKRSIDLSTGFFTTVFNDAFLFGSAPSKVLKESSLNTAEKALAMEIRGSCLYSRQTENECMELCNQLSSLYFWQSNSQGPLVFAGHILYLLRFKGESVQWFIGQVKNARKNPLPPPKKKARATLIVATEEGFLLTLDHKNMLLLPGGAVERGERPMAAAVRELYEETGLQIESIEFLFERESEYYQHHVFVVHRYKGTPSPRSDARELFSLHPDQLKNEYFPANLSHSNKEILLQYSRHRKN